MKTKGEREGEREGRGRRRRRPFSPSDHLLA
jgi:hypothetical protein